MAPTHSSSVGAINSARPDLLAGYADDLTVVGRRLDEALGTTGGALSRYRSTCTDATATVRAPFLLDSCLSQARSLATATAQVGRAFTLADRAGRLDTGVGIGGAAWTDGSTLATTIAEHFPGLAQGPLIEPLTRGAEQGSQQGRSLVDLARRGRVTQLIDALNAIPTGRTTEAGFAVGLIKSFTPEDLNAAVEVLVGAAWESLPSFPRAHRALVTLAAIHATAGRTLDGPVGPWHMGHGLIEGMAADVEGRDALRVLAGLAPSGLGPTHLALVLPSTLLDRSSARETRRRATETSRWVASRGSNGDGLMLAALARSPLAIVELLLRPEEERVIATLLDRARGTAQDDLAQVLEVGLASAELSRGPDGAGPPQRDAVLRQVIDTVAAGIDPDIRPALATTLASTVATDIRYYEGLVAGGFGHHVQPYFEAILVHPGAFTTALEGFDRVLADRIAGSLHHSEATRRTHLIDLVAVMGHFSRAASEVDLAATTATGLIDVVEPVVEGGLSLVTIKGGPAARMAVNHIVDRGFDRLRHRFAREPGTRAQRAEDHRTGLRRDVWLLIARDPRLGPHLVFGAEAGPHAAGFTDATALSDLEWNRANADAFIHWTRAQPAELQDLVSHHVDQLQLHD